MLSISDLKAGERAMVLEMPIDVEVKRTLLVHGIHVGGKIQILQKFAGQGLALIAYNGRKIALRKPACQLIKVVKIES